MKDEDKTKEQLIDELAGLRQRLTELETLKSERKQAEHALNERVKELQCLYGIASIAERPEITLDEVYHEVVNLLPSSWQYPEITCARITIDNKEFKTENYRETEWKQSSDIKVFGANAGRVEVGYLGGRPEVDKEPFLKEERKLIDAVAERLGRITERKRLEEALRESEERYRALLNLGGEVGEAIIMQQDNEQGDAIQTFVSDEWLRITGYSRKELLGMSFHDLLHPKHRETSLKRHRRRMTGEVMSGLFEMSIIRKDGTEVPIEITSAYTTYKGQHATVAFIRDITERKRAEEALRESEAKYKSLINHVKLGVFRSTPEPIGKFLEVNPAMEEITGYRRKELLQMNVADLYVQPEERGLVLEEIALGKGKAAKEVHLRKKDGTEIVVLDRKVAVRDDTGNILYFDGILEDITERKQAEEREKELQRELNLTSRLASIGELAAGVAHEINNPLVGILGFSERLLRKSTDETSKPYLQRIHDEASRAAKVVKNLLTFARRYESRKEYLDINDILQEALELRAYELKTSNIEVAADLASSLPKAMVDFQQIQQVFLNIILNAEQAMVEANRGGKLTIKTQKAKGGIRISFTDDGSGIPADQLDKVFDPFFTTRGERGGTGLGLSVCHGIVTEHGGMVYAESKPGKGTTFFVKLPLATKEIDDSKVTEE